MVKPFWRSKTFWINVLAVIALIAEFATGQEVVITVEAQAIVLACINLILRTVTREPVGW